MPFPSTRVVHPGWASRHAPATVDAMNATCVITHGQTGGGWDPATGPTTGTPIVTYTGPCRVGYGTREPRQVDAAGQHVTTRTVTVSIPRDHQGVPVPAQTVGARVTVTGVDANGPAALVGQVLVVTAVALPSLAWQQDLTCVDDQTPEA